MYLAYGKSDITNLIRQVLHAICIASEQVVDLCLDEFTRPGLMNCLDKCTKIFITDEADMVFADTGLFNGLSKAPAESNFRCMFHFVILCISSVVFIVVSALVMILYDRMFCPFVRRLANKTIVVEKSKLNLLVRISHILFKNETCTYS